jgi:hypothetical protein
MAPLWQLRLGGGTTDASSGTSRAISVDTASSPHYNPGSTGAVAATLVQRPAEGETTMRRQMFGLGCTIAVLASVLLMPTAWGQQPKPGGTLRVAWESDIAGLDPRLSPGAQAGYIMGNLFNSPTHLLQTGEGRT